MSCALDDRRGTIHYFARRRAARLDGQMGHGAEASLLVTDVAPGCRFQPGRANTEVRSVLAAPIVVERQMVGIIFPLEWL